MKYGNRGLRWIVTLAVLLAVTSAVFATQSAKAQPGGKPIAIGDSVEGTIDDQNYQAVYSLTAEAGNAVTLSMSGGGGLDSYLYLKDDAGKTLAEDDDSGGGPDALIKYTFADAGTYTIVATRSGGQNGRSDGSYTLKVTASEGTKATKNATQRGTAVAMATMSAGGSTVAATVAAVTEPAASETPTAVTTAEATEQATIASTSTPRSTRTPRPTATPVITETDNVPQQAATVESTAEPSATVRPTRTPRPTLTRRPPSPSPTPSPFVEGGDIADGSTVKGTIDDSQIFWVYNFQGAVGDQLTITLEGQNGLMPSIIVASADDQSSNGPLKVVNARAGISKITMNVTLPVDGNYFVVATRVGNRQGTSSGTFTMTMAVTTLPAEIQTGADPIKSIQNLVTDNLIPQGGKLLFRLPGGTFAKTNKSPGQTVPIGGNLQAKDFVLQFQVNWTNAGEASGCGMSFRKSGTRDTSFILLTNDGKIALIQRQGARALINYFQSSDLFTPKQMAAVTVIALQDKVTVYVNGKFVTSETGKAVRGSFEANLFNVEGNTVSTNCVFPSGWVWTLDK